jgi:outer membrane immunogenic protein
MRNLLGIAGLASLLIAAPLSAASAADMGMPLKAPPPPPPVVSWTGCYVDGGWGYGMWNQDQSLSVGPPASPTTIGLTTDYTNGGRGWLGRFGGGCDYQLGGGFSNWVIGAFGDYDFMDLHGNGQFPNVGAGGGVGVPLGGYQKESGAWYAGGRIGYLVTPSLLTYVSGGWTETHFDSVPFSLISAPFGPAGIGYPSHTYHGWFIGGGTEYALNFNWLPIHGLFWRTEYRYASYDSATLPDITTAGVATGFISPTTNRVQTITSSLIWRFNWGGPIATRY